MNNNLIREQRVDKNGNLNTKLVKATGAESKGTRAIPAPKAPKSAAPKAPKLTPFQKAQRNRKAESRSFKTDLRLSNIIGVTPDWRGMNHYSFRASDVEMYGVYSATSTENADALMHHGILSKEEAIEFMSSNGLDRIIEDNSALMDGMIERKVPVDMFLSLKNNHVLDGVGDQLVLDAAEVHIVKGYQHIRASWSSYEPDPELTERVLTGKIALEDLKTFGAGRLKASSDYMGIITALERIKEGSVDYTAMQLRNYLNDSKSDLSHGDSIALANAYGVSAARSYQDQYRAHRMHSVLMHRPDLNKYEKSDIMMFNDLFYMVVNRDGRVAISEDDIITLKKSGVDPLLAARHIVDGRPVQQVLAIHERGIAPSISDGWL